MAFRKTGILIVCALLFAACNAVDNDVDVKQDDIVGATANGGRNEVVMVYAVAVVNNQIINRTCSGSYYAPRVVVTAAHCLQGIISNQLFVYYGDNFQQDFAELTPQGVNFIPPAVGAPSHWAQADSFQTHPSYDATLNSADMGVIFLDRKPPFDPLPIYRNRVNANVQVTVSGWGANSTPTPVTGTGAQVQRTGHTVTLGSPTAADYHPEDPNPGMLNAAVRQTVLKTDGRAPNSNGCFGDSGGPIILNQSGQDYVAGVSYWTGLSCADYNLYTRIDSFLPFLDLSYKRGGQDVLKPSFTCVTPNPSGTLTAIFGYENDNGVGITIPYGTKNALARDTSGFRPTLFTTGQHAFAFGVDFNSGQSASWTLSPDNNPTTTVTATTFSPRCTAAQSIDSSCVLACRAQFRSGCTGLGTFEACSAACGDFGHLVASAAPDCVDEQAAFESCVAGTPPGGANWTCSSGSAESQLCLAQGSAAFNCEYYGY
jgi:hypothetical protein